MQEVSEKFRRALRQDHTSAAAVTVDIPGDDAPATSLPVDGGSFISAMYDPVHRSARVTAYDETGLLTPVAAFDLLDPFTTRLAGYRGIDFADGTAVELVAQGVYRIKGLDVGEGNEGMVTFDLDCYDEAVKVQGPLASPMALPSGTKLEDAVSRIITRQLHTAEFDLPATGLTIPPLLIREDSDGWAEAVKCAEAGGYDLGTTRDGRFTMKLIAAGLDSTDEWEFIEGETADFMEPRRRIQDDAYPNVVVVVSTNSATPGVRGEAWDADPHSPTYRYGGYGEVVRSFKSDRIVTPEQAKRAAKGILARKLGPSEEVTLRAIPNPALDIGDTVKITRARLGLYGRRMVVVRIELPVQATDTMTVTCRRSVLTDDQLVLSAAKGNG